MCSKHLLCISYFPPNLYHETFPILTNMLGEHDLYNFLLGKDNTFLLWEIEVKEKAPFPLKSHYSEIKIFNLLVSILLDISLGINTQDGCIIVSFISNISMSVNIEIHYFFYLQIISKHNMFDFCCFI